MKLYDTSGLCQILIIDKKELHEGSIVIALTEEERKKLLSLLESKKDNLSIVLREGLSNTKDLEISRKGF